MPLSGVQNGEVAGNQSIPLVPLIPLVPSHPVEVRAKTRTRRERFQRAHCATRVVIRGLLKKKLIRSTAFFPPSKSSPFFSHLKMRAQHCQKLRPQQQKLKSQRTIVFDLLWARQRRDKRRIAGRLEEANSPAKPSLPSFTSWECASCRTWRRLPTSQILSYLRLA